MDASFTTAKYPGMTTSSLKARVDAGNGNVDMVFEIGRRLAVAEGDISAMTPTERLRFVKAGGELVA